MEHDEYRQLCLDMAEITLEAREMRKKGPELYEAITAKAISSGDDFLKKAVNLVEKYSSIPETYDPITDNANALRDC